jgi:hypothetical protein
MKMWIQLSSRRASCRGLGLLKGTDGTAQRNAARLAAWGLNKNVTLLGRSPNKEDKHGGGFSTPQNAGYAAREAPCPRWGSSVDNI